MPPGERGEALVKGPIITQGYYKNPEANAATFTSDGWLRTGDIVHVVGKLVYVVDRKKVCFFFSVILLIISSNPYLTSRYRVPTMY